MEPKCFDLTYVPYIHVFPLFKPLRIDRDLNLSALVFFLRIFCFFVFYRRLWIVPTTYIVSLDATKQLSFSDLFVHSI